MREFRIHSYVLHVFVVMNNVSLSSCYAFFRLFTRLVLEAPKITPSAMDIIKSYCCTEVRFTAPCSCACYPCVYEHYIAHCICMQDRAFLGVTTLKELILKRPHGPQGTEDFLQVLLEITLSNIELVCYCSLLDCTFEILS